MGTLKFISFLISMWICCENYADRPDRLGYEMLLGYGSLIITEHHGVVLSFFVKPY